MLKNFTGQWLILNFSNAAMWERFIDKSGELINKSASKGYYLTSGCMIDGHRYVQVPTGTLYYKHISNMLHVLMGERPIPSLYEEFSLVQRLGWIDTMAQGALVRVTTLPHIFDDTKGRLNNYVQEHITTRKIVNNCWEKQSYTISVGGTPRAVIGAFPTWEVMIMYLGDLFENLYTILCDLHGSDIFNISFVDAMHRYGAKYSLHTFAQRCKEESRMAFFLLIMGGGYDPSFGVATGDHALKRQRLIIRGVDKVAKLRGSIAVPLMHDSALAKLRQGPGCATLLDGGLVTIQDLVEMTPNTRLNYTEAYVR